MLILLMVSTEAALSMCLDRSFRTERYFHKVLSRINFDIGAKMSNFLATGNLISPTGLDLQQVSGFTIVAEKLNWQRYISHFRCIHRGAFFAELKTTTVRKLLPEAWGMSSHESLEIDFDFALSFRFSLSCSHTRWVALRSPQPSFQNVSHSH